MSITRGERRRRRRPSRRGHRSKRLTLSPLSSRGEGEFTRLRLELLLCLVGETTRRRTDCFSFFQLPFFIRGSTREVLYLRRNKNRLQNLFSLALSCHLGKKERAYRHLPTRGATTVKSFPKKTVYIPLLSHGRRQNIKEVDGEKQTGETAVCLKASFFFHK